MMWRRTVCVVLMEALLPKNIHLNIEVHYSES